MASTKKVATQFIELAIAIETVFTSIAAVQRDVIIVT